jgi:hypothetical protein
VKDQRDFKFRSLSARLSVTDIYICIAPVYRYISADARMHVRTCARTPAGGMLRPSTPFCEFETRRIGTRNSQLRILE